MKISQSYFHNILTLLENILRVVNNLPSRDVIVTMRTKTAYDLVDDGGKKKPVKVGLAPVQRDGLEYEFTVVIDLSVDRHVATAAKDRTSLFDGKHWVPDAATGEALRHWLDSGKDPVEASHELLEALKARVDEIDAVPHLNNWWIAHKGEIDSLMSVDKESLTVHCAARKAAILEALAERKAIQEESVPMAPPTSSSAAAPAPALTRKGNGKAAKGTAAAKAIAAAKELVAAAK